MSGLMAAVVAAPTPSPIPPAQQGVGSVAGGLAEHAYSDEDARRVAQQKRVTEQVDRLVREVELKDKYVARVQVQTDSDIEDGLAHSARLHNGLSVQRSARLQMETEISASLRTMQDKIIVGIQEERRGRQEAVQKLEKVADENMALLRGVLADEAKVLEQSERYRNNIRDEVCHLHRNVEGATKYRSELGQRLHAAVRYKLDEIHEAIAAEQRIRLDHQNILLEQFGEMSRKMDQEMEAARRDRHLSTDRLIQVMETVLPRMDRTRQEAVKACVNELSTSDARSMAQIASDNLHKIRASNDGGKGLFFKGRVVDG